MDEDNYLLGADRCCRWSLTAAYDGTDRVARGQRRCSSERLGAV